MATCHGNLANTPASKGENTQLAVIFSFFSFPPIIHLPLTPAHCLICLPISSPCPALTIPHYPRPSHLTSFSLTLSPWSVMSLQCSDFFFMINKVGLGGADIKVNFMTFPLLETLSWPFQLVWHPTFTVLRSDLTSFSQSIWNFHLESSLVGR